MRISRQLLSATALACASLLAESAHAGTGVAYLSIPPDARTAGTADQGAALGRGATGLFSNPAAAWNRLAPKGGTDIAFGHNAWGVGINEEWAAWSGALGDSAAFGADVRYVSYGTLELRREGGWLEGSFGAKSLAAGLSYARAAGKDRSAGLAVRLVRDEVNQISATTAALDIGAQGTAKAGTLRYGAALRNLGLPIAYSSGSAGSPLPLAVSAGGAYRFPLKNELWGAADLTAQPLDGRFSGAVGFEAVFAFGKVVESTIRAGLRGGSGVLTTPAAGLSVRTPWVSLDYAFLYRSDLDAAHRVGLQLYLPGGARSDSGAVAEAHGGESAVSAGPGAPRGLRLLPKVGSLQAVWTAPAGPAVVGYHVYAAQSGGELRRITTRPYTKTDVQLKGAPGSRWSVAISAVARGPEGEALEGPRTPVKEVRVLAAGDPPPPPQGVAATGLGGKVAIEWLASEGAIGYYVYVCSIEDGEYQKLNRRPTRTLRHEDPDVAPGTPYYYRVTAVGRDGRESAASETASAKP